MFENPEIAPETLPSADEVDWQALDPRYVRRLQLKAAISTLVIFGGLLFVGRLPLPVADLLSLWLSAAIAAVILTQGLAWPAISVPRMGYAIRSRDVLYRSGVAWRSMTAIPFNRVQHVETSSTPLDRRFGLATLKLYTAGGAGGDLRIHGMPAEVAERLRRFVLERVGEDAE